jgi:Chemoreceptor zinc-binding domain
MEWMKVVNGHVMWKQRLRAYLDGKSEEKLDPDIIGRDDQCPLGQWIYGDGKAHESASHYDQVKTHHAQFHTHAAEIVRMVDAGNNEAAEKLLTGDYAKLSERLKHEIITLYQEVSS